jgi:hypothetical protein
MFTSNASSRDHSLCSARISCRWVLRLGSRCWATTMGASKSSGSEETMPKRAPIPPAEDPTTTRCVKVSSANAPPHRPPCGCSPGAHKHDPESMPPSPKALLAYSTMPWRLPHHGSCWMYKAVAEDVGLMGGPRQSASGRGRPLHGQVEAYGRGISRRAPGTVGKVHGSGTSIWTSSPGKTGLDPGTPEPSARLQ